MCTHRYGHRQAGTSQSNIQLRAKKKREEKNGVKSWECHRRHITHAFVSNIFNFAQTHSQPPSINYIFYHPCELHSLLHSLAGAESCETDAQTQFKNQMQSKCFQRAKAQIAADDFFSFSLLLSVSSLHLSLPLTVTLARVVLLYSWNGGSWRRVLPAPQRLTLLAKMSGSEIRQTLNVIQKRYCLKSINGGCNKWWFDSVRLCCVGVCVCVCLAWNARASVRVQLHELAGIGMQRKPFNKIHLEMNENKPRNERKSE